MTLSHTAVCWIFVFAACVQGDYIGCFVDNQDRILTADTYNSPHLTTDQCIRWCLERGNLLAGTQYKSHCFCGDDIDMTKLTDGDDCNMPCSGDGNEICGGFWRMSVYKTEIQTTTVFTATVSGRHTTNADIGTTQIETQTTVVNIESPTTTNAYKACTCKCYKTYWNNSKRLTTKEKLQLRSELQTKLAVMKNSTSMFKRKLISEYDSRPSSITMGCFAIVILSLIVGMIIIPDVINLISYVHRWRRCHQK
ncbi:protein SLG1-like [Pecten maximus]|uniref:protein SLG1-like n=1 Tax=Pecten maximus TaxID=6579 RepID=UPI00145905CC|nr:protein SLG1-like [Pecten maximus]